MTSPTHTAPDDVERVAKACFLAHWPKDDWHRFGERDYVGEQYRGMAQAAIAALQPAITAAHQAGRRGSYGPQILLRFVDFVALWTHRENVSDAERLSAIKHHPVVQRRARAAALPGTGEGHPAQPGADDRVKELEAEVELYSAELQHAGYSVEVLSEKLDAAVALATDLQAKLAAAGADVDRLRKALIASGRSAGAYLADEVSTDFLMRVPEEVKAKIKNLAAAISATKTEGGQ